MVEDLVQSWYLILGMFSTPPCLASMKCVRLLYIIPSLPLSFMSKHKRIKVPALA